MKKNKIALIIFFTLVALTILFGQKARGLFNLWKYKLDVQPSQAIIEDASAMSLHFKELTPEVLTQLQEVDKLIDLSHQAKNIIAISESQRKEHLLTVDSDGILRSWNVQNNTVVSRLNIGVASSYGINFSSDGHWLVAPGITSNNELSGYQVFNTEDGTLTVCRASPNCPPMNNVNMRDFQILSPNGKLILEYAGSRGEVYPILDWRTTSELDSLGFGSSDCLFRNGFDDFHDSLKFRSLAISTSQKYVAYVVENGIACVRDMGEFTGIDMSTGTEIPFVSGFQPPFRKLRFDLSDNNVEVNTLAFDPTDRWLAVLTSKTLAVWNLSDFLFPNTINYLVSTGTTLSFDRRGDLLALGTTNGIIVFSLADGKQIAEFKTTQVTNIYFTRDNRMLVWGDINGGVHLWGVPQK